MDCSVDVDLVWVSLVELSELLLSDWVTSNDLDFSAVEDCSTVFPLSVLSLTLSSTQWLDELPVVESELWLKLEPKLTLLEN